ncbi:uracil-DNA glycosylase family protein [Sphingomonas sp. 22R3R2A-7]|uniref:uracil-DNA glycosylase family protein n=1 Tax=Sphingomonas sp. 22R3R2A-7 TaxID=3050230 RepID=UPI002FE0B3D8
MLSTLDWWQEAGVDTLVDDAPRDWFAAPQAPTPAIPAAAVPVVAPSSMPHALADFLTWRNGPDVPEASWGGISLTAAGPADATVMVLVDCPDRDDCDETGGGALLSGASGRLLDRMLAAIGLTRSEVHLASVCAKRPTAGRIQREVEDRLAEIAKHHIQLIAPPGCSCWGMRRAVPSSGWNCRQRVGVCTTLTIRPERRGSLPAFIRAS